MNNPEFNETKEEFEERKKNHPLIRLWEKNFGEAERVSFCDPRMDTYIKDLRIDLKEGKQ